MLQVQETTFLSRFLMLHNLINNSIESHVFLRPLVRAHFPKPEQMQHQDTGFKSMMELQMQWSKQHM